MAILLSPCYNIDALRYKLIAALEKNFFPGLIYFRKEAENLSLNEILDYIEENLKQDLTLEELSQRYHYSPRQLYYYLHTITGMPVMAYVRKRKLISAAREIGFGRKMYDVAMDYGFETQAGFYKAFLQCIGCTPSEFRRHQRLRHEKRIAAKLLSVKEAQETMGKNSTLITIRKMEEDDAKSLWENIFSANTPEEVKLRVQSNIAKMAAGNCVALVATADGHVIGTALAERSQHILSSNRCLLSDVIVNPAFQRQGLGKRLCEEIFVYARQMGCDYAVTYCRSNGTELFDMAIGMEQCGRIPGGVREPWGEEKTYDELIFYKQL